MLLAYAGNGHRIYAGPAAAFGDTASSNHESNIELPSEPSPPSHRVPQGSCCRGWPWRAAAAQRVEGDIPMIRIRSWWKWQGPCISRVIKNRNWRNNSPKVAASTPLDAPFSMQSVSIGASFDQHFAGFAEKLARGKAESYFVRVLQYAAHHGALFGVVDVDRKHFGTLVLSRAWDVVSTPEGGKVHDALVASGMCLEVGPGDDVRVDFEAHLESVREKASEADQDTPTRARSLPDPSRPGPARGKGGKEGSGSAPAPAVEAPPVATPLNRGKVRAVCNQLDHLLAHRLAPTEMILSAQVLAKAGKFAAADALIAEHGNGATP